MTTNVSPVIGVFDEPGMADTAMQALADAGFADDQVSYSGNAGGGFLSGLKSLFTGEGDASTHIVHDLMNMGVSENRANYYANEHNAGRAVVMVQAKGREEEARAILNSAGGYDRSGEAASSNTTGYHQSGGYGEQSRMTERDADVGGNASGSVSTGNVSKTSRQEAMKNQPVYNQQVDADPAIPLNRTTNANQVNYADTTSDAQSSLRLREERLQANKQMVQTGEVRLGKDIVQEQKSINVPVTHEEVVIERRPGSGNPSTDTTPIGQDEIVRIPLSQEQVNVTKTVVETGEVTIGKRAVTENQTFSDTVRHEEVRVDNDGNVPIIDNVSGDPEADDNVRNRNINPKPRSRNRPQQ